MADVSRQDAWQLVTEWVESDSLRKHLLGVEAAMRAYAHKWGEDEELYAVTGLVHDLDYERHPDLETGHPRYAIKELLRLWPRDVGRQSGGATWVVGMNHVRPPPSSDQIRLCSHVALREVHHRRLPIR